MHIYLKYLQEQATIEQVVQGQVLQDQAMQEQTVQGQTMPEQAVQEVSGSLMDKSWASHEHAMLNSCTIHVQVMNKPWTSHEQDKTTKPWTSH